MRWAAWLVVGGLLAGLASADPTPLSGAIYLTDVLVVGEGETLSIAPGSSITGLGSIEVRGALLVEGNASARIEIAVPIRLLGNGSSRLSDARLWSVQGAALTVAAGEVTLERVSFVGNEAGLVVAGPSVRLEGRDLSFQENVRGLVLDLALGAADVGVTNASFQRNGQHVAAQFGSGREPVVVAFERCDFGPVAPVSGARLPSVLAKGDALAGDDARRALLLRDNRLHGGDVALRVEGRGFHVDSRNDSFAGNRVALSLAGANVTLRDARLDSTERDVDGASTSSLSLQNVTMLRAETAVPRPVPGGLPAWVLPVLLVGVATAAASAWIGLRPRPGPAPAPGAEPAPHPVPPPAPALDPPLKPIERRILGEAIAQPGSAQAAIAARMGLSRQALHYHVKKLEARGLLVKSPQGRETRCFVPDAVAEALRADEAVK